MMCTSRCVLAIFAVSCAQQSWDSLHDVHGPSTRRRPGDRRRPGQGAASQASGFSAGTATSAGPRRCGRCGSPGARSRCSTSFWATLRRQRFPRPRQAAGARGSAGASRPRTFPPHARRSRRWRRPTCNLLSIRGRDATASSTCRVCKGSKFANGTATFANLFTFAKRHQDGG